MADFQQQLCPSCGQAFMLGSEFYELPEAFGHCPFCATEFRVGKAAELQGPLVARPADA